MTQSSQNHPFLPILWLLAAIGIFSTALTLPSMPAITKAFNASDNMVQLSLSLLFLGSAVGNLLLGPISDKKGRLMVAKGGLIIFIVASIWCAEAQSIHSLIIARFFQGVGSSCGMLVARAVGRDLYEGADLAHYSSTVMMVMSVSPAIAPTLGGYIEFYVGWKMNFYFLMAFGIITAAFVWLRLPETKSKSQPHYPLMKTFINYALLFKEKAFSLACLILFAQMASIFSYVTLSPYLFINLYGWTPQEYGFLGVTGAFGNIVGFAIARRLAYRIKFGQGLFFGSLLTFICTLAYIITTIILGSDANSLIIYTIFFYVFSALATVNASSAAMNLHPEKAGVAAAMIGAIQIGSGFFGGLFASLIPTSPLMLGIVMGVLCLISLWAGYKSWLGR